MATSFQRRRIRIRLEYVTGMADNKQPEPDIYEFTDFRSQVDINQPGGFQFAQCNARIYGIDKATMDRFTFINYQNLSFMRNVLIVEATDEKGEFCTIFKGEIFSATPEYQSAPNVSFNIQAQSGLIGMIAPSKAISFPGARRVSEIMQSIADEVGMYFENNGVDSVLTDQSLGGTALEKARTVAESANIEMWYIPAEGVLAIAPRGGVRKSDPVVYNIDTGLIGWPSKMPEGISFSALFNPSTRHGCRIEMDSSMPSCNGKFSISSMSHSLSCNEPNGPWMSTFIATPTDIFVRYR